MATTEDVRKLAALARIRIADADLPTFTKEFDSILAYVGQLEALTLPEGLSSDTPLRNVMRADGPATPARTYTEKLAAQFPEREGDALVVKQIIDHD